MVISESGKLTKRSSKNQVSFFPGETYQGKGKIVTKDEIVLSGNVLNDESTNWSQIFRFISESSGYKVRIQISTANLIGLTSKSIESLKSIVKRANACEISLEINAMDIINDANQIDRYMKEIWRDLPRSSSITMYIEIDPNNMDVSKIEKLNNYMQNNPQINYSFLVANDYELKKRNLGVLKKLKSEVSVPITYGMWCDDGDLDGADNLKFYACSSINIPNEYMIDCRQKVKKMLIDICKENNMTDFENLTDEYKAFIIAKYITTEGPNNWKFDRSTHGDHSDKKILGSIGSNPKFVFDNRRGICGGFATAFSLLLNNPVTKINCITVSGEVKGEEGHAWTNFLCRDSDGNQNVYEYCLTFGRNKKFQQLQKESDRSTGTRYGGININSGPVYIYGNGEEFILQDKYKLDRKYASAEIDESRGTIRRSNQNGSEIVRINNQNRGSAHGNRGMSSSKIKLNIHGQNHGGISNIRVNGNPINHNDPVERRGMSSSEIKLNIHGQNHGGISNIRVNGNPINHNDPDDLDNR